MGAGAATGRLVELVEEGYGLHTAKELLEQVALVRRVDGVSLQTESHKERVCLKNPLHICKDSNGTSAAARNRLNTKDFCHCL